MHCHSWKSSLQGVLLGHWRHLDFLCCPQIAHVQRLLRALRPWYFHANDALAEARCLCVQVAAFLLVPPFDFPISSSSPGPDFFLDSLPCFHENIQSFSEG